MASHDDRAGGRDADRTGRWTSHLAPAAPAPLVLAVGEVLWDLLPDGPRLGGAPLNVAAHLRRLGHPTALLSAVGDDALGEEALRAVRDLSVDATLVAVAPQMPTGVVEVTLGAGAEPEYAIRSPAAYEAIALDGPAAHPLAVAEPGVLVFGTLAQCGAVTRATTRNLIAAYPTAWRVYDVNLRRGRWTPGLVADLLDGVDVLKLNEDEMSTLAPLLDLPFGTTEAFCRGVADRHGVSVVCVTRGPHGVDALVDRRMLSVPAVVVEVADPIGAGDAFTAGLVDGLMRGRDAETTLRRANALGAFVATRAGAIPAWTPDDLVPYGWVA